MSQSKDVVISGISGCFPKADNLKEFSEKLFAKENLLSNAPYMPCKLGKLNDLRKFDAEFFGFHQSHRVNVMDPMARMILEKAYEAVVDSGNNPFTLKGSNCGVFIGIHFLETEVLVYEKIQKGASLAISRSFNANRISHWLGIHGPSYVVDAACSSTLVALEIAYNSIRSGQCDSAIVGGCNICLHPALLLHLLKVGALNPKGEPRVFDQDGGFCKAETIGIMYLQKAQDAKRIYARVINVKSNHDGNKPSFLQPQASSQAMLLKTIYEESEIDSDSVMWIEAHATGTQVGDKEEVVAVDEVFRNRTSPLMIGSVKSNMGHAEAAAGVASIAKVILAMETGYIPPNINIANVRNDTEALRDGRIKVITEKTPWNGGIVGISGFGIGGANTHAVLESWHKNKVNCGIPDDDIPRIVGVSGRTAEAVDAILNYLENASLDTEFIGLLHNIHKYNIPAHPYRGFTLLRKSEICLGEICTTCISRKTQDLREESRPVWFVFTNYVRVTRNMFGELMSLDQFRNTILEYENMNIFGDLSTEGTVFNGYVFAVVLQIALYNLLTSLEIIPDGIIGCGMGEIVCAYIDGCLTFENALRVAGHCASFFSKYISESNVYDFETYKNDPTELKILLEQIIEPKLISKMWITGCVSASKTEDVYYDSDYFVTSLLNGSNFESALKCIPKNAIVIDFAATKLSNILGKNLKAGNTRISIVNECEDVAVSNILTTFGQLYLLGVNPHFDKLYPTVTYPVSRATAMVAPLIKWNHSVDWPVAFSSFQDRMLSGERKVSVSLDDSVDSYISGHEINSVILYPGTGYLVLVWETFAFIYGKLYNNLSVIFENIRFRKAVVVPSDESITFNVSVHKGNGDFEILENGKIVATGRVRTTSNARRERITVSHPTEDPVIIDGDDFYKYVLRRNQNYKGSFRSVKRINSEGTLARVTWSNNWVTFLDGMLQLMLLNKNCETLSVIAEIEKIVIDVDEHYAYLESNESEFDVLMDRNMNIIDSVGVQIKNCSTRAIPSQLNDRKPLLQKYVFSSYISQQKLLTKHVIPLYMQIFMDYVGQHAKGIKIAEIMDDTNVALLSPLILDFMKKQSIFQADVKTYTNDTSEEKRNIDTTVRIFNRILPLGELVHLISCVNVLNDENKWKNILNSLFENGFIITRENPNSILAVPPEVHICCDLLTTEERVLLLKKKEKLRNTFKVIKISCKTFEWIEELQKALKIPLYDRIVLFSEKEPYSGILGFYNCLRAERNTEKIRCFFIDDENAETFSIDNPIYRTQLNKNLAVNIYKNKTWGCYVRLPVPELQSIPVHHAFVKIKTEGNKRILQWTEGPVKTSSSFNDLMHVYYATVNRSDVLLYKNLLAAEEITKDALLKEYALGMEFSGKSVTGKRYMGFLRHGCLSTYIKITSNDIFLNEVPNNWSLEDAVTVPLAYYIALYAFVICAKLQNQEAVLIHSAANSVGQAAINIATYYNCDIFITISSIDEKLFIKQNFPYLPESRIGNSNDASFEKMIYEETNTKGVNVILNSLSEDKFLTAINCLAFNGRFIQIKKTDLSNISGSKLLSKNVSLFTATPEAVHNLANDSKMYLKTILDEHIKNHAVKPLVRTAYSYSGIESAFESELALKIFRKCVVQIIPEEGIGAKPQMHSKLAYPRFKCQPDKSYIICGGLGGMGMELANWLIVRGAKKIVLTSRKGITKGSQRMRINRWISNGTQVIVTNADISDENQTMTLLDEANTLGDVEGVFNLAAVLKDAVFKNQTANHFEICSKAKLQGSLNLHRFTLMKCANLKYFVVFSSISSGYGNIGQTNYGMCNSAVERLCEQRRMENLPALAIEWGPVGNVGMFVAFMDGNITKPYAGNHMQPIESCLQVLDQCLNQDNPVVASLVIADKGN